MSKNLKLFAWARRSAGVVNLAAISLAFAIAGCGHSLARGKLIQRGYLWQRDWTPAVVQALHEAKSKTDGVILLGAEILWTEKRPDVINASIDWNAVRREGVSSGIAVRVASTMKADKSSIDTIIATAESLRDDAVAHGITLSEFQLDFDCPQKDLAIYRSWVSQIRAAVRPVRFVITTLPAWLEEPEFVRLIGETDGYVLQVHSVPTSSERSDTMLCDPKLARTWIEKANRLGRPFAVALPTYRCSAGYGPSGKLLGVAMDSVQPKWPPDTRILEFETDPNAMAELVAQVKKNRPGNLEELLWYRLPVAIDVRNWRWRTLAAVMEGRKPVHRLEALPEGENPVDVVIANQGEADESLNAVTVTAAWKGDPPTASDALNGWTVSSGKEKAVFSPIPSFRIRLAPGGKSKIGWLRFPQPSSLQLQLARPNEATR